MNIIDYNTKNLVIVESPNKVKTISNILKAAGYTKTTVLASVGHIMMLQDGGPAFNSGIYPKQNFKMNLAIMEDKQKIINEIMLAASKVDKIFIMTDGDREGELIAWSIINFCKLPIEKCQRVITHEITSKAILEALENPLPFNDNLVNAGLTRLMIDKLIGYGLSPLGKKYIGAKSIGRCQSVGLKLISDRETEINNFIPEVYFNLYLNFEKENKVYKAKYTGYKTELVEKFAKQADVDAVFNDCNKNPVYQIKSIEEIIHEEAPKAPFCTATFQQEASTKLGLRVKDAMSCAQKLFEGLNVDGEHKGLITYMRTDSTELAPEFVTELKNFIINTYGTTKYANPRKTKRKSTDQNGHEAIRVIDLTLTPEKLASYINNNLLIKVYRLIWQRTVAAAMANAIISETRYTVKNGEHKFEFSTKKIQEAGYRTVYEVETEQPLDEKITFALDEALKKPELEILKKFTQPKPRFTEASLVKELQQKEIGRPSTYASIVETILSPTRGYAKLEDKYIIPTDRGMQLAEYCNRSFSSLINLSYTKEMEQSLDKIALGETPWLIYMDSFYKNLKEIVDNTKETGLASDMPEKLCPKCNNSMIVRRSRFGRLFYGCSTYPKCNGIINID